MDLAERFSISTKKDDYPTYLLFLQGKDDPIKYTGDAKNADQINKFLMKESGILFNLLVSTHYTFTQLDQIRRKFCFGLVFRLRSPSRSTIFQSCWDGATASSVFTSTLREHKVSFLRTLHNGCGV